MGSPCSSIFTIIWKTIFCIGFYIWFLLCVLPCFILAWIVKTISRAIYRQFDISSEPSSTPTYDFMSGPDAACCLPGIESDENKPNVSAFFCLKGELKEEDLKERFSIYFRAIDERLVEGTFMADEDTKKIFDKLRCYPVRKKGYYFWKRVKQFDVGRHVAPATRPDGSVVTFSTDSELQEYFNRRIFKPFPKKTPPWEVFWLYRKPEPEVTSVDLPKEATTSGEILETAVCFRLHHSLGDGISLCYAFLTKFMDGEVEVPCFKPVPSAGSVEKLHPVKEDLKFRLKAIKWYQRVFMYLQGVVVMPIAWLRFKTNPDRNPLIKKRLTGKKIVHWLDPIPMEPMKKARSLFGGITINDIVSTAKSRAVWRYLIAVHSGTTNNNRTLNAARNTKSQKSSQKPREVRYGARGDKKKQDFTRWTLSDASTVSFWSDYPRQFTNKFGMCRLRMQQPMESDSINNLFARRGEIDRYLKRWNLGFPMYMGSIMAINVFPAVLANWIMAPPKGVTVITSNVRGPPEPVTMAGLPVTRAYAFPPQMGKCGLSIMTFGYEKHLYISIVADTGYIPGPEDATLLGKFLEMEIQTLVDALSHMAMAVGPDNSSAV